MQNASFTETRRCVLQLLGDESLVERWFDTKLPSLGGKTPRELCTGNMTEQHQLEDHLELLRKAFRAGSKIHS